MSDLQWASVTQAPPVRVRLDGATSDGPVVAPAGVSFAVGQRVVTEYLKPSLLILGAYATSATPVAQNLYLKSPDGSTWLLTVSNSGTLGATKQ